MLDAARLEIWNHRLAQIAEEMGAALRRSAFSTNIKERQDYSCAIFDGEGRLIAQAAHIPVHLGSTALSVRAVIAALSLQHDEIAIINDPYSGGTHLPDVTLVAPLFVDGKVLAFLAARAHHADVGGTTPGSMPVGIFARGDEIPQAPAIPAAMAEKYREPPTHELIARPVTIDEEGVRISPTVLTEEVIEYFAKKSRGPEERRGDLAAQCAAIAVGRRALQQLIATHGEQTFKQESQALCAYSARRMRALIATIPDGIYAFADSLDDDGAGRNDIAIRLTLQIAGEHATLDFSDSDEEVDGPLNAVYAVTLSSVLYAFQLLLEDTPANEGLWEPLTVIAPAGCVLNARSPRAVSAGNVETSQRIVDVVLGALSQALPEKIPAASCGTMSNLLIGDEHYAYYETIAGGAGGSATADGGSALQTHMTNTLNSPIEAIEEAFPLRIEKYARRRGSGGGGVHRGGDGVIREFLFLEPATVTLIGERRRRPPYGLSGGGPAQLGEDTLQRGDRSVRLPGKVTFRAQAGDRLTIATPGGGGFGDPLRGRFWATVLSGEPFTLPE